MSCLFESKDICYNLTPFMNISQKNLDARTNFETCCFSINRNYTLADIDSQELNSLLLKATGGNVVFNVTVSILNKGCRDSFFFIKYSLSF